MDSSKASSQTGSELRDTQRFARAESDQTSGRLASDSIFGNIKAKGIRYDPGADVVNSMMVDDWPHHGPVEIAETVAHLQALIEVLPAALESSRADIRHSQFTTDQRLNKAVEMLRSYRLAAEVVHADRDIKRMAEQHDRAVSEGRRSVLETKAYREGERVIRKREADKLRTETRKTSKKVKRG